MNVFWNSSRRCAFFFVQTSNTAEFIVINRKKVLLAQNEAYTKWLSQIGFILSLAFLYFSVLPWELTQAHFFTVNTGYFSPRL